MSSNLLQYIGQDDITFPEDILNLAFFDLDQRVNNVEARETLRFYIQGNLATAQNLLNFPWPFETLEIEAALAVKTVPVGADIIVQGFVSGSTIWDAADRPKILNGQKFGVFSPLGNFGANLEKDFEMNFVAEQVGTAASGADLSLIIRAELAPPV